MKLPTEADRVIVAKLIPHETWCHSVAYAECRGSDLHECDCLAGEAQQTMADYVAEERAKALRAEGSRVRT